MALLDAYALCDSRHDGRLRHHHPQKLGPPKRNESRIFRRIAFWCICSLITLGTFPLRFPGMENLPRRIPRMIPSESCTGRSPIPPLMNARIQWQPGSNSLIPNLLIFTSVRLLRADLQEIVRGDPQSIQRIGPFLYCSRFPILESEYLVANDQHWIARLVIDTAREGQPTNPLVIDLVDLPSDLSQVRMHTAKNARSLWLEAEVDPPPLCHW